MFMANIMDFWRNEWKSVGDYSAVNSSDSLLSFDYNNSKTAASCKIMKKVFIIIFIVCSTFVRGQNPFDSCFCMESMSDDDVAGVMDLMTRSGFTYITRGGNTQNCYRIKDCCNNKTVLTCMAFVFPDAGKALKAKALFEKKGNKHGKPELLELVLNHNHIVVETMQNVLSFNILYGNQYDDVWRQVRNDIVLHCQSDGKNVENQFFSKKCCDTLSNVYSNSQSSDHCVSIELSTVPNENSLYITYTNNTDSSVYFIKYANSKVFDFPEFNTNINMQFLTSEGRYGAVKIPDCSGEHYFVIIGKNLLILDSDTNFLINKDENDQPPLNFMIHRYYYVLHHWCRKEKYFNDTPQRSLFFLTEPLSEKDVFDNYSNVFVFLRPREKYIDCIDLLGLTLSNATFDIYLNDSYQILDNYSIENKPFMVKYNKYIPLKAGEYYLFNGPFISNSTRFPHEEDNP